jgi:hypothetical protein
MLEVARCNPLEMRANAAQLCCHKAIEKMQPPIQPGKQRILDLIVDRECDLSAVRPNFSEINDPIKLISTHGLKSVLIRRVAVDREQDCMRLEAERAAKAEINRFRGGHGCPGHHKELPPI